MKKFLKNHFGFTLIEMITAFAVLGVASLAIGGFFVSSSRSYASSSSETGLQYEAQMALNQIEGKLIDATLGVNYNLYDGSNNFVEQDIETENILQSKILYIFDSKDSGFEVLLVKWDIVKELLLYKELPLSGFQEDDKVDDIEIESVGEWQLLAEGVKNFSADLSKYKDTKTVDVEIGLEKRNRRFETIGTITLRNNVLVNASDINDIFSNVSGMTATRVDGVVIKANTNVTKPGGEVQLTTRVTGVYPSQDISKWLIAYFYDELNSDLELDEETTLEDEGYILVPKEVAEITDKKLHIKTQPDGSFHQTLYVQAIVKDENGNKVYSNIEAISVRDITGISIWPTADLGIEENEKITADEIKTWDSVTTSGMNDEAVKIYPSNKIQMIGSVNGLKEGDNYIIKWSVVNEECSEGVIATINEGTGLITIDRNSQKGKLVVKAELQGTDYWAKYAFAVSSPYTENDKVKVIAPANMNRGEKPYQCQVEFKDKKAEVTDYNWSVSIETTTGDKVSGNPVEISPTGILTVKDELSFDYSYKITVYAAMKSDPSRYDGAIVTVPQVSMFLSTTDVLTPKIGSTIPAGKIICNVVGLTEYDVAWTIAKETNPTYYFTAYGNTNITGTKTELEDGRVVKTPKITIGGDEPKDLTYMRVKATLVGYSNYVATLKLPFNQQIGDIPSGGSGNTGGESDDSGNTGGESDDSDELEPLPDGIWDSYTISDGNVSRNGNVTVYAKHNYWNYMTWSSDEEDVVVDKNSWEITRVTVGGQDVHDTTGISLIPGTSHVVVKVDPTFRLNDWDKDIKIYVNATSNGQKFKEDGVITLNPISIAISGQDTINENNSADYKCTLSGFSGVDNLLRNKTISLKWDLEQKNKNVKIDKTSDNGKTAKVSVSRLSKDEYFKLKVSLVHSNNEYATKYYTYQDRWIEKNEILANNY